MNYAGGSLLTYLKSRGKSLTTRELAKMCLNTAAGMKYLEEKCCIHRDLAARNCLIGKVVLSIQNKHFILITYLNRLFNYR